MSEQNTPNDEQSSERDQQQAWKKSLKAARIEDYAVIGDCETAALVSRDGSIDWLCWPSFASPACFTALLGTGDNGYWSLRPAEEITSISRRYRPGTMILETTFCTASGEVCLTDFMPPRGQHSDIIRMVRGVRGQVPMRMELALRFDYGLTVPWVTMYEAELHAIAGPNMTVLRTFCADDDPLELHGQDQRTVSEFMAREGQTQCFVLTYASSTEEVPPPVVPDDELNDTEHYWCEWSARSAFKGEWADAVLRSLMTLKALTYRPTGGMVAAVTMALPEEIGGERNWDYRYCWLRDTAFSLLVLVHSGYTEEAVAWRKWLLRAVAGTPDQVQIMYGLSGERQLQEWEATWLCGYEKSTPVRIGNAASTQFQIDVFGEVALVLNRMPHAEDDIRVPAVGLQAALVDHLCHVWDQPDDGIWETRGGRQHFVHSKVMAWVALDRAIKAYDQAQSNQKDAEIAKHAEHHGDVTRWRENRRMLHDEICEKGFNKELNSFTQAYGSKTLDAACLRIGMVGFLPMDDPRIIGTIDAVQKNLLRNGFVDRYRSEESPDGLHGTEGSFLACSFWLVVCLHCIGRTGEAREMFERLLSIRNDLGLLSEEYDPVHKRMLGNFPQALSHIALVHAAFTLTGNWHPEPYTAES